MSRNTASKTLTIHGHPLVKAAMDNLRWMIEGAAPKMAEMLKKPGGLRKRGKIASHPACDLYDRLAFDGCSRILSLLDRLGYAREMVLRFPQRSGWERAGISRDIWLEYHYSYFLVSLCSLPDLSSLLTNNVFRLGLMPRHCKPWVIKENAWIRGTAVEKGLCVIEDTIKGDRLLRNLHIHEGETPDPADLTDSDLYDMLKITAFVNLHGDLSFPAHVLTAGFRAEAKAIAGELSKRINKAAAAVDRLFDALFPIYQATERALHSRPSAGCGRLEATGTR